MILWVLGHFNLRLPSRCYNAVFFEQSTSAVTVKTPKYVLTQAEEKPSFIRQHWLLFSLLGLAAMAFVIGRYSNIDVLNAFKGQKETWEEVNQELALTNEQQLKTISRLQTEVKVKEQAIAELQRNLMLLTEEKDTLRVDLAFYENLLSHKDDIKSLRVFDLEASGDTDMLSIKLVLAQKLQRAQVVEGVIGLQLTGIVEGQGQVLDLVDQFKLDDAYSFKYFQIKKYTISLPKGFIPTTLLVELQSNNKRQSAITETFDWSEIWREKALEQALSAASQTD